MGIIVSVGAREGVAEGLDVEETEATPQPVIENSATIKIKLITKNLPFMETLSFHYLPVMDKQPGWVFNSYSKRRWCALYSSRETFAGSVG